MMYTYDPRVAAVAPFSGAIAVLSFICVFVHISRFYNIGYSLFLEVVLGVANIGLLMCWVLLRDRDLRVTAKLHKSISPGLLPIPLLSLLLICLSRWF